MAENKDFLIKEETLTDIADSIRNVDNTLSELSPSQMSDEIRRLTAIIEQDFDANSPNAQSGKAVAEAVNNEKERAMAAEKTEQENRDMADDKLQSQINNLVAKQATQQEQVITRTLSENTVTETFDAPNAEQVLVLQDENKTGSIKFDKDNDEVVITSNGKLKLHNVDDPTNDTDATNKTYVDTLCQTVEEQLTDKIEEETTNRISADNKLQDSKLDKITTPAVSQPIPRVYAITPLGEQTTFFVSTWKTEDTIARRTNTGTLVVSAPKLNEEATTKEYVDTADKKLAEQIANITAVQIRNKSEVIEANEDDVQTVATQYIKQNYQRDPQNFDGLIITVTDKNNDKILYIYSEVSSLWINSGINDVDLSNYYTKDEINDKVDTINESITTETELRTTADASLQNSITANEGLITTEVNERKSAISALNKQIISFDVYSSKTDFSTIDVLIPAKEI